MERREITVLTYGTFDLFHIGHLRILQRAKMLGDHLIVGISTDDFNLKKNKKTVIPYHERAEIISKIEYVDCVLPEACWEQKTDDIIRNNVDVFVMGHDWEGKFDFLSDYCEVIYLPRTKGISTTKIKTHLQQVGSNQPLYAQAVNL